MFRQKLAFWSVVGLCAIFFVACGDDKKTKTLQQASTDCTSGGACSASYGLGFDIAIPASDQFKGTSNKVNLLELAKSMLEGLKVSDTDPKAFSVTLTSGEADDVFDSSLLGGDTGLRVSGAKQMKGGAFYIYKITTKKNANKEHFFVEEQDDLLLFHEIASQNKGKAMSAWKQGNTQASTEGALLVLPASEGVTVTSETEGEKIRITVQGGSKIQTRYLALYAHWVNNGSEGFTLHAGSDELEVSQDESDDDEDDDDDDEDDDN